MFLTRISVRHPVFATMVMVAILVFGINAFRSMPIEQFPDVDFPIVAVLTPYTGAAPEAVETEISEVIEEAVNTLSGIDTVSSTSSSGHSTVIVQFTLETDSIQAAQEVRDRLAAVTLPDGADMPQVLRFDPTATPMVSLALSGEGQSMTELTRIANDIVAPAMTNVEGVGSATVVGSTEEQVDILIDPDRLNAYGIGVSEVVSAFASDNMTIPSGSVDNGLLVQTVQLNTELDAINDFASVVVARQGSQTIMLGDVADIVRGQSELDGLALQNGEQRWRSTSPGSMAATPSRLHMRSTTGFPSSTQAECLKVRGSRCFRTAPSRSKRTITRSNPRFWRAPCSPWQSFFCSSIRGGRL